MPALEPYLGEISIVSFNFAPRGWALCNGQLIAIQQNPALFSILGTTYGGDGIRTFGLPDFQGRTPIHTNTTLTLGWSGGEENHTLTTNEIPQHLHTVTLGEVKAKTGVTANLTTPENNYFADNPAEAKRFTAVGDTVMNTITPTLGVSGSTLQHSNLQPYLVLNFTICLQGIFPSRN